MYRDNSHIITVSLISSTSQLKFTLKSIIQWSRTCEMSVLKTTHQTFNTHLVCRVQAVDTDDVTLIPPDTLTVWHYRFNNTFSLALFTTIVIHKYVYKYINISEQYSTGTKSKLVFTTGRALHVSSSVNITSGINNVLVYNHMLSKEPIQDGSGGAEWSENSFLLAANCFTASQSTE